MVARFVRDEEAAGSNPVSPTIVYNKPSGVWLEGLFTSGSMRIFYEKYGQRRDGFSKGQHIRPGASGIRESIRGTVREQPAALHFYGKVLYFFAFAFIKFDRNTFFTTGESWTNAVR